MFIILNTLSISKVKWLLIILCLPFTFMTKAFAQRSVKQLLESRMNADEPGITANEASTKVGNNVYVCDLISGYKPRKNRVKEVYIGDKDPLKAINVVFQNNIKLQQINLIGSTLCISGKVVKRRGRATIIVSNPDQLAKQIQI
jgi:ribosomal protein L36